MQLIVETGSKIYPGNVQALRNFSLTLGPGVLVLLGPNGAGKSTLMRILATITKPTSGRVVWNGADIAHKADELRSVLGYLPQDFGIYPNLTAVEFLDYLAAAKGISAASACKRIRDLLEIVNLTDAARRPLGGFSGGMRQRVGIAQALLNDPKLLIVDEPTAGLDPEERIRFRNLLSDLGGNRTVLLSTHIVEDIAQTCLNLDMMNNGQVIFQRTTVELASETRGKVWIVTTDGVKPEGNFTVVSTLNMGTTIQYRVVGELSEPAGVISAVPTEPSLEDSYVWLMREKRSPVKALGMQDLLAI